MKDDDYFQEQEYRGYLAGRIVVMGYLIFLGAAIGWIARGWW